MYIQVCMHVYQDSQKVVHMYIYVCVCPILTIYNIWKHLLCSNRNPGIHKRFCEGGSPVERNHIINIEKGEPTGKKHLSLPIK